MLRRIFPPNTIDTLLLQNGYGTTDVMSMEQYGKYESEVELKLMDAESERKMIDQRFSHEEVFSELRLCRP
jgi:hypothetical protein